MLRQSLPQKLNLLLGLLEEPVEHALVFSARSMLQSASQVAGLDLQPLNLSNRVRLRVVNCAHESKSPFKHARFLPIHNLAIRIGGSNREKNEKSFTKPAQWLSYASPRPPSARITRAGTPATVAPAGTSSITTAPAPTMAWAPIFMHGTTLAPIPMKAASPTSTLPARAAAGPIWAALAI